jgi:hypothetical protein
MRVMLHICWQIQLTCSSLHYVNSGRGQIQSYCSTAHSVLNIQLSVSQFLFLMSRQFDARYTPHLLPNTGPISRSSPRDVIGWGRVLARSCQMEGYFVQAFFGAGVACLGLLHLRVDGVDEWLFLERGAVDVWYREVWVWIFDCRWVVTVSDETLRFVGILRRRWLVRLVELEEFI